jgi:hypothetical protein
MGARGYCVKQRRLLFVACRRDLTASLRKVLSQSWSQMQRFVKTGRENNSCVHSELSGDPSNDVIRPSLYN